MQLSLCLGFLGLFGLLACSDANGQANNTPSNQSQPLTSVQAKSGWTVDTAKSNLLFEGSQSGAVFSGVLGKFTAAISFNPNDLANAKAVVIIDMKNADAGEAERTDALPGKEWFYVKKFPVAKFETLGFEHIEGDSYKVKGNLTIRDITQEITLPFTLAIKETHAVMDAKITLNRTLYNVGTGMWASKEWVGHDVVVNIHIEAEQSQ